MHVLVSKCDRDWKKKQVKTTSYFFYPTKFRPYSFPYVVITYRTHVVTLDLKNVMCCHALLSHGHALTVMATR